MISTHGRIKLNTDENSVRNFKLTWLIHWTRKLILKPDRNVNKLIKMHSAKLFNDEGRKGPWTMDPIIESVSHG